jgi:hypothetical protein
MGCVCHKDGSINRIHFGYPGTSGFVFGGTNFETGGEDEIGGYVGHPKYTSGHIKTECSTK